MTRCNFFLPVIRLMPTDVSSRRGARPIAVEPQVFDLLVHLVQNRDRIVRKDDRLASVRGAGSWRPSPAAATPRTRCHEHGMDRDLPLDDVPDA